MKSQLAATCFVISALFSAVAVHADGVNSNDRTSKEMERKIESMKQLLKTYTDGDAEREKNLATFDTADFVVFSGQDWVRFHESHDKDVVVSCQMAIKKRANQAH